MNEKIYQWIMHKLSQKFPIFQWLFKSHIESNSGRKLSNAEWKRFVQFFNEWYYSEYDLAIETMGQLSELGDKVFLLFEEQDCVEDV